MKSRFRILCAAAMVALTLAAVARPRAAVADDAYPTRPVRIVIPFAPGGGADVLGRIIGEALSERLGQPVVIENRPGANGNLGMEVVARAPADGYTLVLATVGTWAVNPHLYRAPFDVVRDFAPIMQVTSSPGVLVVNPRLPVQNVGELIAYARAHPGQLNYGSAGIGGFGHISAVMFSLMTGTQMTHVPYRGAGPAVADAIGGQIQLLFNDALATMPHVTSGNLRAIAVTSLRRMPLLPDMPSLDEAGVPGFDNSSWAALAAPAGTPRAIITKLNRELTVVLAAPATQQRIAAAGATIIGGTPEEFAAYLRSEIAKFERIVRDGHITLQ